MSVSSSVTVSREWSQTGACQDKQISVTRQRMCVKKTAVDVGDNLIEDDGIGDNVIFLLKCRMLNAVFLHFVSSMSLAWLQSLTNWYDDVGFQPQ